GLGHEVVGEAADGEQAFDEYSRLRPDVVTMDLTMEISDGALATSKIIAADPSARIIVVSARQDRPAILDALERGARHFIIKPVSSEKVASVLNNVLQQTFDKQQQLEMIRRLKGTCDSPDNGSLQPARVLIVDDSAVARQSLRDIVAALGHVVIGEAASGVQAFVEYIKLKPDVVTMDLTMQGMGGAEAISKIIAADPEARIIVVSATEVRKGIIDALERGARHFIVKPIRQEKVAAVLNAILRPGFDRKRHLECVRKLKESQDSRSLINSDANKCDPPYAISAQDNSLVHVFINQSLTVNSCQTLFHELTEHLDGSPRVLLDFGIMSTLDEELLLKLNELIETIETNSGTVRAISNNQRFVDTIAKIHLEKTSNLLAEVLRFFQS
ncbi:MAG: response regulator, partial [Sporomusa sp.]|nr:response regulator [Sporomusa sp.]